MQKLEQEIALFEAQLAESRAAAEQAGKDRASPPRAEAELPVNKELAGLGESDDTLTTRAGNPHRCGSTKSGSPRLTAEKDLSLASAAVETLTGRTGEAEARARELHAAMETAGGSTSEDNEQAMEEIRPHPGGKPAKRIAQCEQIIRDCRYRPYGEQRRRSPA